MPSIRILTWNSTGESFPKAASLAAEAATHAAHATHPVIDIYLIQEAQQGAGGAISNYLTGLAGYTVHHIHENLGGGGKGYICATRNASVTVSTPLHSGTMQPIRDSWPGQAILPYRHPVGRHLPEHPPIAFCRSAAATSC